MDVPIRCVCPPKADGSPRHEGDTITLRDTLGFREVTTIRGLVGQIDVSDTLAVAEILATLTEGYIIFGVEAWTLRHDTTDDKGRSRPNQPIPVSRAAIREHLLSAVDAAADVGDAADGLYGEKVVLPLLMRASRSSQGSPTDGSTSPTTDTSEKRPTPLKRSSTGSSRTVATAPTSSSLDGDSSSSPTSASVA